MASAQLFEAQAEQHLELIDLHECNTSKSHRSTKLYLTEEVVTAPVFSYSARVALRARFQSQEGGDEEDAQIYPQYGLLGHRIRDDSKKPIQDGLVYTNVSSPWSAFICGSQGSGKSHTLSCILENSLIPSSPAGNLTSPLAGLVLHYDKFTAFSSTQLCEAAWLCSSHIPVRVLVSPTNLLAMKNAYSGLAGLEGSLGQLKVQPMYLPKKGLNISMMKTLMGIDKKDNQPLYIEVSEPQRIA